MLSKLLARTLRELLIIHVSSRPPETPPDRLLSAICLGSARDPSVRPRAVGDR